MLPEEAQGWAAIIRSSRLLIGAVNMLIGSLSRLPEINLLRIDILYVMVDAFSPSVPKNGGHAATNIANGVNGVV